MGDGIKECHRPSAPLRDWIRALNTESMVLFGVGHQRMDWKQCHWLVLRQWIRSIHEWTNIIVLLRTNDSSSHSPTIRRWAPSVRSHWFLLMKDKPSFWPCADRMQTIQSSVDPPKSHKTGSIVFAKGWIEDEENCKEQAPCERWHFKLIRLIISNEWIEILKMFLPH